MGLFKKQTPEEKAERAIAGRNARNKTLITSGVVTLLTYVSCHSQGSDWAATAKNLGAFVGAGVMFFVTLVVAGLFFSHHEDGQAKLRLAQIAKDKLRSEQQAALAVQDQRERDAQERKKQLEEQTQKERFLLEQQKRRDNREFLIKKLTNANRFVDLYDPSNSDTSARVRQGLSKELEDIMVKHTHAELSALMAQEPDVRGMVVLLGQHLTTKGINSHEAAQILATLS